MAVDGFLSSHGLPYLRPAISQSFCQYVGQSVSKSRLSFRLSPDSLVSSDSHRYRQDLDLYPTTCLRNWHKIESYVTSADRTNGWALHRLNRKLNYVEPLREENISLAARSTAWQRRDRASAEESLLPAAGRTIEIGFGTGLNLPHFPPDRHLTDRHRPGTDARSDRQRTNRRLANPGHQDAARRPEPASIP
jgi:hypothetical protein